MCVEASPFEGYGSCLTCDSNNSVRASLAASRTGLSAADIANMVYSPPDLSSSQERGSVTGELILKGYLRGFRTVFLIGAGLAALSFLVALFLMPELGLKREDDQRLKEEGENKALRNRQG